MKKGLRFAFTGLILIFIIVAFFLVSGFSFKTFTGKITGNAVVEEYVIMTSGQTGIATCKTGYSCKEIYLQQEINGELEYLLLGTPCSEVIYNPNYFAYCVPTPSGGSLVIPSSPPDNCQSGYRDVSAYTKTGSKDCKLYCSPYGNEQTACPASDGWFASDNKQPPEYTSAAYVNQHIILGDAYTQARFVSSSQCWCTKCANGYEYNSATKTCTLIKKCSDGTNLGQIEIGTGSAEWLCTNYKGQLTNLDCRSALINNVYVPSIHANTPADGWVCGRWGWECGGKGYNSGYCCGGVNQQTPCLSISSVTPSFGLVGTTITITGTNFGTAGQNNANGVITFINSDARGISVRIDTWDEANDVIRFKVPPSLAPGVYSLSIGTSKGSVLKENAFRVTDGTIPITDKSCENYYSADSWSTYTYLPTYDESLLVKCDSVSVTCTNKYDAIYGGKCYSGADYSTALFHRTVQKNIVFTGGNDKIALTYNSNGWDSVYYGKWIDCDTTAEHCTACDNSVPSTWTGVNANLNISNNVEGIANCVGAQCWIKSGETSVGEYKTQTQAGCCGDDPNEYFVTANGNSACCNNATDIVDAYGNCVAAGGGEAGINPNLDCTCAIYDFVKDGEIDVRDISKVTSCKDNPNQAGCPSIKRMDINGDGVIKVEDIGNISNLCWGPVELLSKDCDYDAIKCQGCILGSNCVKAGTRVTLKKTDRYCSINNHWLIPKVDNVKCNNDYECVTNVCVDGKCLSIKKELEKQTNLLKQIWCWLQHPLSATERQKCYSAN